MFKQVIGISFIFTKGSVVVICLFSLIKIDFFNFDFSKDCLEDFCFQNQTFKLENWQHEPFKRWFLVSNLVVKKCLTYCYKTKGGSVVKGIDSLEQNQIFKSQYL